MLNALGNALLPRNHEHYNIYYDQSCAVQGPVCGHGLEITGEGGPSVHIKIHGQFQRFSSSKLKKISNK
jgi:hypothetical protein